MRAKRQCVWMLPTIALAFLLAGCATNGGKLDVSTASEIHDGQTQAEVHHLLGVPKSTESGPDGRKLEIFSTVLPERAGANSANTHRRTFEVRTLCVLYNPKGQVEQHVHNVGKAVSRRGFGKDVHVGQWLPPDKVAQVKRGMESYDVVGLLGPATVIGLTVRGDVIWSWINIETRNERFETVQEFQVVLDDNGRVKYFRMVENRP